MIDVIANQEKEETRNGVPAGLLHSLALNAFSKMPHEKQMAMAARYRDFSNAFKEGLAELKASRGGNCEITQQDVQNIMENIQKSKSSTIPTANVGLM